MYNLHCCTASATIVISSKLYIEPARIAIGMRGILIGRSIAIAKTPFPPVYRRHRHIGEVDSGSRAGICGRHAEVDYWWRTRSDTCRYGDGFCAPTVGGYAQCKIIRACSRVHMCRRILCDGGKSLSKVPETGRHTIAGSYIGCGCKAERY